MRLVTITSGHPPYNAGEVAAFPDAEAEALIAAGKAAPLAVPDAEAEPEPEAPPPPAPAASTAETPTEQSVPPVTQTEQPE